MYSLFRQQMLFDRDKLDDVFPVKVYDEETKLFHMDGNKDKSFLGGCFLCSPLSGANASTVQSLKSLLGADFPTNTIISIHEVSSIYIEPILLQYLKARLPIITDTSNPERAVLTEQYVANRLKLMRKGVKEPLDSDTQVLLNDMYIIVSFKVPVSQDPTEEEYNHTETLGVSIHSALKTLEMGPEYVNNSMYLMLMRSMLYPNKPLDPYIDVNKELNEQIFRWDTHIKVEKDHLQVDDVYVRSMSVSRYPERTCLPVMSNLLGDPQGSRNQISCPYVLTTHIFFPDPHSSKMKVQRDAQGIKVQSMGKLGRYFSRLGLKNDNYQILEDSLNKGNRTVKMWTNLLLFSTSYEDLVKQSTVVQGFYEHNGFIIQNDTIINASCFQLQFPLAIVPEAVGLTQRFNTVTVEHAPHLLPVVGDWKGNGKNVSNMFFSRRGQLATFCLFNTDTNQNACIFGEPGAGKSFLCNDILFGLYTQGAMIRIIDSGYSYRKTTGVVKGEFIDFASHNKLKINPFTHLKDINQEMPMLVTLLSQMAAPNSRLTDYQLSKMQQTILQLCTEYKVSQLNVTLLHETLIRTGRKENDRAVVEMGEQLFPYTRHGSHGHYFDGDANLTMSGQWSCLELDSLADNPQLRTIVLMMMMIQLTRDFMNPATKKQKGILLIDEFWRFADLSDSNRQQDIGTQNILAFINEAFRVFRKHNKSIVIATQSPNDLGQKSPLLATAAVTFYMKQKPETINYVKEAKLLDMSDAGFDMLKTLRRKGSEYSDLYVSTSGRGGGFLRFVIDRFTQLLYTTQADEESRIRDYEAQGMSIAMAINAVIADEEAEKARMSQQNPSSAA